MKAKVVIYKEIHSSIYCNDKKDTIINREIISYKILVQHNTDQLLKKLCISMCQYEKKSKSAYNQQSNLQTKIHHKVFVG